MLRLIFLGLALACIASEVPAQADLAPDPLAGNACVPLMRPMNAIRLAAPRPEGTMA